METSVYEVDRQILLGQKLNTIKKNERCMTHRNGLTDSETWIDFNRNHMCH